MREQDELDALLGGLVNQGWEDPPPVPEAAPPKADIVIPISVENQALTEPEYPPVPVREAPQEATPEGDRGVMDIGLLTDLAAGRKTAVEAARFAGVSVDEIQSSLAVALREVPPEEIAKAMGLQAAEQQLKSGALYGAVLADLVADMAAGRLKPETKIELAKLLARVGRVEPKEDKGVGAGGGFVLNINLGNAERPVTIDAG